MSQSINEHVVVVGLGYVGLPLAVALARTTRVTGLDIDTSRIAELRESRDRTHEVGADVLAQSTLAYASDPADCAAADVYIITVPTPVDAASRPDLRPLLAATRTVAQHLVQERRPVIVYESTVYPGVTEDLCGPLLEEVSGLKRGVDFFLGYSPERINPGDREHSIDKIVKVVAGENAAVLDRLATLYDRVTDAGTFKAKSIRTAEAAKVIENAQRDINIAFMNEITQIFEKLGLSALDVLEAAGTKWNFLNFRPGLVGGHCIGVDPYYLSHCAQSLGHLPRVILAGRAINDGMGSWIADRIHSRRQSRTGSVLILGVTFKEDVPDLRNSKVLDVVNRLRWLGHHITLHDPIADPAEVQHESGLALDTSALAARYDVVLVAVSHRSYCAMAVDEVTALVAEGGLVADLHGIWRDQSFPEGTTLWSL
ncbi:nucleotide sugar dehydrogenase [Sphingomonas sp. LY54]|uniref:nucleotide sugar dehydrogenase n=1 Tax=Sphingomonas sp. LY54 TaxID=3095343 RepID=UPI002D77F5DC|nr:nucleotide sugar dehydrogenase [Sphingomonas sp. LY54]WRP27569.1 nucleotide sugar dehydrogenase [Sphingomonas sp. LY54]